jgi:hypothetical protein
MDQRGNARGGGHHRMQEPEPLGPKLGVHGGDAGEIAARVIETGDETGLERVPAGGEDDRNRRGRGFGGEDCRRAVDDDHDGYPAADQIGDQFRQPIVVVVREAVFDRDSPTLDVPGFAQAFAKRRKRIDLGIGCAGGEIPDHRHPRLLRPRRERPRCRAAEKRYEVAAL